MKRALTILAWLIAIPLAAVTAFANYRFGFLVGSGEERYVYAIGGTVLDVAKTFLPTFLGTFLVGRLTAGTFGLRVLGWSFWGLGVVWSIACALGLYNISREAKIGDVNGQKATYRQLTDDQAKKQNRLSELKGVKLAETIEGEIAAQKRSKLWTRTKECMDATAAESRSFCAGIDTMTAALATAPRAADVQDEQTKLRDELHKIDLKLAGMNMDVIFTAADPAIDAVVNLTGWKPETAKARLALLLAFLFEVGGILLAIVHYEPVIDQVQETRKKRERHPPAPQTEHPPMQAAPDAANDPNGLDLPEEDSLVAQWSKTAMIRRKGSFVPSAESREDFSAWCRSHGHEPLNPTAFGKQMTALGFDRKKKSGVMCYLDVALVPKARALKVVASNG